jgi:hypothetical protein
VSANATSLPVLEHAHIIIALLKEVLPEAVGLVRLKLADILVTVLPEKGTIPIHFRVLEVSFIPTLKFMNEFGPYFSDKNNHGSML